MRATTLALLLTILFTPAETPADSSPTPRKAEVQTHGLPPEVEKSILAQIAKEPWFELQITSMALTRD